MPVTSASPRNQAPKWRRRAAARPDEILEAALAEFTERGFETARMEDVAKRAGLSKAGVYLYFPSKTALLEALIEARVTPLALQAERLADLGRDDPLLALRLIARTAAERMRDPMVIAVPRLVISISAQFPEIAEYYRTQVVERARRALERLIQAAMDKGALRETDPAAVTRAFVGPLFFEAMWTHVLRGESALTDPEKLVEQHIDILLHGLEHRA